VKANIVCSVLPHTAIRPPKKQACLPESGQLV